MTGPAPRIDPGRLGAGEWLVLLGALGVLVALFLPWYAVGGVTYSGWDFAVRDVLLAALAGLGIVAAALCASQPAPALPLSATVLCAALGVPIGLLVLLALVDPPGAGPVALRAGAWLGAGGVLGLTLGAWLALRREAAPGASVAAVDVPVRRAPPA